MNIYNLPVARHPDAIEFLPDGRVVVAFCDPAPGMPDHIRTISIYNVKTGARINTVASILAHHRLQDLMHYQTPTHFQGWYDYTLSENQGDAYIWHFRITSPMWEAVRDPLEPAVRVAVRPFGYLVRHEQNERRAYDVAVVPWHHTLGTFERMEGACRPVELKRLLLSELTFKAPTDVLMGADPGVFVAVWGAEPSTKVHAALHTPTCKVESRPPATGGI